jgi:hypothetical protein
MLETSRTLKSVRMCSHDIWTDDIRTNATLNYSKVLDTDGSLNGIATSSGRMLLTDERPDALLSRTDEILGFDFSELESVQNLLGTL